MQRPVAILLKSLAFAAGFALLFFGQVVSSPVSGTVWLVPGLMLVVIMLLGALPSYRSVESRLPLFFAYGSAFSISYIYSMPASLPGSAAERVARLAIPVLFASMALSFIAYARSWPRHPSARWITFALSLGLVLAYFSGQAGGTGHGGWERWLTEHLGLAPDAARIAVILTRKTVHIAFYGILSLSAWLASRKERVSIVEASIFAGILAMSHAGFDELRQSFTPDRTGSAWDLLIDLAGVVLFLSLANRRERITRARVDFGQG